MLGALHHAPPGFLRVFDARETSIRIWYGVMRPYTGPLKILILWYIGDGWECELCLHSIKGENI